MASHAAHRYAAVLACALAAAIGGCSRGDPDAAPQVAAPSDATSRRFGEFEIHYNAVRSDFLTPEVARAYGIARSANRVLLNVSVLHLNPDGTTTPVDAGVTATAYNLNGQLKQLSMRRVTEGSSVYYIGEVEISGNEILVFDISAAPAGPESKFTVQFKREFYAG
ncbi:MAG: DUF4426 domain-containing protein [Steroidobacteraceae bacterium]